eukprot:10828901-Alexandrium_andersonii.AAC.1
MLVRSAQLGWSRCADRATMAVSPHGQGRTPPQWITGAPSEPPPNERQTGISTSQGARSAIRNPRKA